jgi:5-hydroxyisourate hydrolase-like protein (transthyretin family)
MAAVSQQPPASGAIAGTVVNAVSGEPLANVQVTLARTDMPAGAFAQLVAGNPAAGETILSGEMLSALLSAVSDVDNIPATATDRERALANAMVPALKALPLADIRHVIVNADDRSIAVVRKSLQPVQTDSSGRFAFDAVEPGTYRVIFSAAGYAKQDYGQRLAEGKGTPVVVRAGEGRLNLAMRLIPTGAVSGIIRNTNGQPVAGVPVELQRSTYDETGRKTLRRAATTRTDDRGEYRMYYLTPGRYYLTAGARATGPALLGPASAAYVSPNRLQENHGLLYYPGVADSDAASTIDVRPGAEVTRVDMTLGTPRSYIIRGRVVDRRTGAVFPRISVRLMPQDFSPADLISWPASPLRFGPQDGTFEFRNVTPGAYVLTATPTENGIFNVGEDRAAAVAPIVVSDSDLDGVLLELGNTGSLTGTVRLDPAATVEFVRSPLMQVHLLSADLSLVRLLGTRGQQWPLEADGSFELSGLRFGDYYVSMRGLPSGFFLKEARFEQTDVLNMPLRFSGNTTSKLDLVVSPNSGSIAGRAIDGSGQPVPGARVVLIPAANRERTHLFKAVTADSSGSYAITAVAPGDYILASWEAIEPYAFFDPELIREAETAGTRVRIGESSSVTLNVTAR